MNNCQTQLVTKIIGVGTDIVSISRISKVLKKYPEKFPIYILTPTELAIFHEKNTNKDRYLAKRFAGKEAIAKAMGTGIGKLSFQDIEILSHSSKQPYATITNSAPNISIALSLTDDSDIAAAVVIIYEVAALPK